MSLTVRTRIVKHSARNPPGRSLDCKDYTGFILILQIDFTFKIFYFFSQFLSFAVESPLCTKSTLDIMNFLNTPFIWINSRHVFLSSVWKLSLKGYSQTPEPPCVLWSSHYPQWLGLHCTPPPGVAFFLHFAWLKSPSSLISRSRFTDLTTKHFTGKKTLWIFLLSVLKTCFLVSLLKTFTHWVSP